MDLPTYITGSVQTRAYGILREEVSTTLGKYDLTPTHWAMLGIIIVAKDGIRQSEIAKALAVKPPLITIMSRKLHKQGLIQSVTNQFDTRAKLLSITPYGKKLIKNIDKELHSHLSELLTGLTEDDLITYHKVLQTIISNRNRLANT